ncbi:unnamed protein product [Toxocara canis]|uniref:Uncharacterized protein n=1 Tax=Toxocara canis TaxID=6265 RepID=A0A183USP6_TOXCA|nr:unnamed protein product [Toxocara canis]
MACNPCCCWNVKDGVVTIGIWSMVSSIRITVYAFASLMLFGWQFSVISQCRSVTVSQANLQCEYWCPCVGASNARTTALIEGRYSKFHLCSYIWIWRTRMKLFGWMFLWEEKQNDRDDVYDGIARSVYVYMNMIEIVYSLLVFPESAKIYCLFQLTIFGWQMAIIKYEKDRAANILLPNYYEYGRFDVPSYYESFWQSPEERFYTGLFVIQILCLISSFFLLFASVALMYGAHTYSRYLIWPWFPCMIASILTSLAYCIMWWTGDVRSYWLILTILEIIVVLINLYCLTAVLIFYRQILADRDYYEANQRLDNYDQYPRMYDEYRKDNYYSNGEHAPDLNYSLPPGYQKSGQPSSPHRDEYRRLSDYNEEPPPAIRPKSQYPDHKEYHEDDMVSNWVKDQQTLGLIPDHANSEPTSPVREPFREPLQVTVSFLPSALAFRPVDVCGDFRCNFLPSSSLSQTTPPAQVILKTSTQGRRSRLPARLITAALETKTSFVVTWIALTKIVQFGLLFHGVRGLNLSEEPFRHRHRSRSCERYSDESTPTSENSHERRRRRRREERERDKDRERPRGPRQVKRSCKERESKSAGAPAIQPEQPPTTLNGQWQGPLSGTQGGITIPQHIIIPPSSGAVGKDGRIQPQTYQINSEIRILYDQYGRPLRPQTTVVGSRSEPASQQGPSPAQPSYSTNQRRPQVLSAAHLESDHGTRDRKPTPL